MRLSFIFLYIFISLINPLSAEEAMDKFKILQEFENFYETMQPAQEKNEHYFIWFSGIPHPLFNAIMHLSCDENVNETVDSIIHAAPYNTPISFWLHSQNQTENLKEIITKKGFHPIIVCPLMSWSTQSIDMPPCDIQPANMEIFHDILAATFHFDKAIKEGYAHLLERANAENYLLYLDGKPIGTGTLFFNGKVGAVFNIAILPDYQKNGYGKILMQFLMQKAYALNAEKLILLSSPDAEKLYLKLGFKKELDIEIYAH